MPIQTFPYNSSEYLKTPRAIAVYIRETVASGDQAEFAQALPILQRARQMHGIVGRAGEVPSTAAVPPGEELSALLEMLSDLGFRLTVEPVEIERPAEAA